MRGLTVYQPSAELLATGRAKHHIRPWKCTYRGRLVLCAAGKPKTERAGQAVCVATLRDVYPYDPEHAKTADRPFSEGYWAWEFDDVTPLPVGITVRGYQRVFEVPAAARKQIAAALQRAA